MRKKWIFFVAPPMLVLFIAIGGEVVMQLWNWLLPALFGWRQITFWQGLGLLALCRILRLWWWRRLSLQVSAAHGRALGADDARGAREVPARYALALRQLGNANRRNQGAGLTVPPPAVRDGRP